MNFCVISFLLQTNKLVIKADVKIESTLQLWVNLTDQTKKLLQFYEFILRPLIWHNDLQLM